MKVFVKDPEIFLKELGVTVPGTIARGTPARLEAEYRSEINREIYFFADLEKKQRFDAHPELYCGVVTDPVTGERYRPEGRIRRFDYMGRPYIFASVSALTVFQAAPDSFAVTMGRMVPKGEGG